MCLTLLSHIPPEEKVNVELDNRGLPKIYFKCLVCEKEKETTKDETIQVEYEKMKALNFEQWVQLKFEQYDKVLGI